MTDKQLILLMIKRFGYETDNDGQVLVYTGLYEDDDRPSRIFPIVSEG